MSENAPEMVQPDTEAEGWSGEDSSAYPEFHPNPHNHRFTLSYDPQKPPFLVVRANTVAELTAAFEELEEGGVYAAMGNAWRVMKAQATVGAGIGPTTPVPAAPGAPVPPTPAPPAYPQPTQAAPGVPGTAPAAWQNAGAPTPPPPPQGGGGRSQDPKFGPKPRPTDWPQVFRIQGDQAFRTYREENKGYFTGKVRSAGGGAYWVHGEVVQAVANWNPVPA